MLTDIERKRMSECISQASDLVLSAELILKEELPHIAYHLAILALEELGKREIIKVNGVPKLGQEEPVWLKKGQSDHITKLFWCIFGVGFEREEITPEYVQSIFDFAEKTHAKRLQSLYVDENDNEVSPRNIVTTNEAKSIVEFARTRYELSASETFRNEIPEEELELQRWFLTANQDSEKRKFIFSKSSFKKLSEVGAPKWVKWLREELVKQQEELNALMRSEIQKINQLPEVGTLIKWKVRVRFFSLSHTVRQQALNEWNDYVDWLKLYPAGANKDEIIAELLIKNNVPLQGVWHISYGILNTFLVALNIGTMGFWWWHSIKRPNHFYETIEDVEMKHKVEIAPYSTLDLAWPVKAAIKAEQMRGIIKVFSEMPPAPSSKKGEQNAYDHYLGGLTFLGSRGAHWDSGPTAFSYFVKCLHAILKEFYKKDFEVALQEFGEQHFNIDERSSISALIIKFHKKESLKKTIESQDLINIKLMCDVGFIVLKFAGKRE